MLDIPAEDVQRIDAKNMLGDVLAFPSQLEGALAAAGRIEASYPRAPRNVVLAGMGGSAIGGDLLAHWLEREAAVPAVVSRSYELPRWAGPDTLVIAASFSGNTEETLAAFAEASRRGCMLAAVTTGGRLAELARRKSAPLAPVEAGGLQPRAALARMLVPQARLLESAGVLKAGGAFEAALRALQDLVPDLAPDASPGRNEAKRVALAVNGTVPAVYASDALAPAARRWANDFSENGKVVALWGVMPEMNHNELVGWAGDEDLDRFTAVFLRHAGEHRQNRERFGFTGRIVQERGGRLVQVSARGEGLAAEFLTLAAIGTASSIYLAILRGKDPTPVEVIGQLKDRVAGTGFAKGLE